MTDGDNLLGLVGTGSSSKSKSSKRPRAHTTSAAVKRTRASSDASIANGDDEPHWARPNSLGRMSSDFAQTRNNLLSADERTPLLGVQALDRNPGGRSPGARSTRSVSITGPNHTPYDAEALTTPRRPRPSSWRNMLRAPSQYGTPTLRVIDTPDGEAIVVTRPKKKRHPVVRYMSPLWSGTHWLALVHLILINLPMVSFFFHLPTLTFRSYRSSDVGLVADIDSRNTRRNGSLNHLTIRSLGLVPRSHLSSFFLSVGGTAH
jgi:hypothetical protein